jgi:hypothetical protein
MYTVYTYKYMVLAHPAHASYLHFLLHSVAPVVLISRRVLAVKYHTAVVACFLLQCRAPPACVVLDDAAHRLLVPAQGTRGGRCYHTSTRA